jgi:hypothetical protein
VTVPHHDPGYLAVVDEQLGCLRSRGQMDPGLLQVRGALYDVPRLSFGSQ